MTDESIFAAALAIGNPAERAEYLDRVCAGQPALRQELGELIAAHGADNPLDRAPCDVAATGAYAPAEAARSVSSVAAVVGARIGRYKLLERIGEGGMGDVWVADQQEPLKRRVALKLIKPGMDSRNVLARFEAERQALAVMDHPNIARVLDAGTAPDGRPFFVMELVKGTPITEFCDARRLTPRQRLELFVPVCQAIQHAHQKGVIHRDVKPSNVLVALHDETPVPKVIDFGVAKAVGQQLTEKTIYTGFGALVGTPAYMAPEQATFNQLDVDTRADVYALGVLLYELLAGSPPVEPERLRKAALEEVLRIVRDEEPPRPSQRLSTSQARATIAATRQTDPLKLSRMMRGELDWIVMKALEKDRVRRYETANGLAKDVQRYLAGDAVEACPPSLGYRLTKAIRKHRTAASVAVGFLAVLLLGSVLTAWQAIQATHAEADAARQRDEAISSEEKAVAAQQLAETERANVDRTNQALRRLTDEQRRTLYATSMNLAQAAWESGNPAGALTLLRQQMPGTDREDLRRFEWHYWQRRAHGELKTVRLAGYVAGQSTRLFGKLNPNGTRVAGFHTMPGDRTTVLKFWDAETGTLLWSVPVPVDTGGCEYLDFSADGRRLVTARDFGTGSLPGDRHVEVHVWDTASGKPIYTNDFPAGRRVGFPSLSADGTRSPVKSCSAWLRPIPGIFR